jgi:hypothetical protein
MDSSSLSVADPSTIQESLQMYIPLILLTTPTKKQNKNTKDLLTLRMQEFLLFIWDLLHNTPLEP